MLKLHLLIYKMKFFGTSHINRIIKMLCSIVLKNSKKVTIPIMVPYRLLRIEMRLEFKLPRASISWPLSAELSLGEGSMSR
jgi:hypothetical protein